MQSIRPKEVFVLQERDESRVKYAVSLYSVGKFEEALREIKALLEKDPSDPYYNAFAADCMIQIGNYQQAEKFAGIAQSLEKDNPDYSVLYALALFYNGKPEKALQAINSAIRRGESAERSIIKSQILLALGREEDAVKEARKAVSLEPSEESNRNLGSVLREAGMDDEAEEVYRKIAEDNPNDVEALRAIFEIKEEQGKLREALEIIDRCIEIDPEDYTLLLDRSDLYMALDDPDMAMEDALQASMLSREAPDALLALARIERERGLLQDALKHVESAMEDYAEDPEVHAVRAEILKAIGRTGEATEECMEAVRLGAESDVKYRVGLLLYEMRKYEEAGKIFSELVDDPVYSVSASLYSERCQWKSLHQKS
ncbi:hypothetical protein GCM10007108_06080 [Thermogymnomonas acidicola]|uniref:Tetratrico peptide repeat group 5 domain-containing protein n=1 Tax=Thermogymnomonas acidicola TaxID=399579 RepID=A0AA37BRF5_9ARCH|nr:hypothetical protein GCM10007108_06080 [Thermogymnomonas acidicola]